ncbi:MAG: hypothetical protein HY795_07400 [Desulfovibrio sp.]|nr:hypothetical protein [Desulfovibrio sp.]MBI4960820.1 hypothetical protein [Desulfovibrio sp.]
MARETVFAELSATQDTNHGIRKIVLRALDPLGAADRVVDAKGDQLRFIQELQTLWTHDGQRYSPLANLAEKAALDVLVGVHREFVPGMLHVTEDGQPVEQETMRKFQAKLRTPSMIAQVLKFVRLDPRVHVRSNKFDANPYEINLLNGLLNLETLELAPHAPTQLVTKLAPVSWNPEALCPYWHGFIDDITDHDKELAAYLQRLCGYCLTGSTEEEVMPILYGGGANGKSRFLAALRDILGSGEYALTLGTGSILNSKYHGIRCDLRLLEAIRTAFAIETNQEATLDEAVVKSIVAADEISARALRQNPVQFVPQAKIIMAVNHLPGLVGNDHGIQRRIQVVPFRKRFDGKVKKEEIERKIQSERDGIFAWMVRGFADWKSQGLNPPEVVLKATDEYLQQEDQLGEYLSERTIDDPSLKTPIRLLFEDYAAWAKGAGVKAVSLHQFSDQLKARGKTQGRVHSGRVWNCIGLRLP